MTTFTYYGDQERPAIALEWLDGNGSVIDFHTGYTFSAKLVSATNTIVATEVAGVAGAATSPNVTVTWTDVDLSLLTPGVYELRVYARSGGKDNVFAPDSPPSVRVKAAAA